MDSFYRCAIDVGLICLFTLVFIFVLAIGVKAIDWIWKKVDLEAEIAKDNKSAAAVVIAIVLSMTYAIVEVFKTIVG